MPLRIMIIEDEHVIALDLRDILEGAGHTVIGHATAFEEALQLARRHRPQVALTDMDLAGARNGLDTAAALGSEFGIVPLFITAREDFLVRAMDLPVEPLGYIGKPYRAAEVLDALAGFA